MTADAGGERLRPVLDRMAEAATDWLASLRPAQRAKAGYPFTATQERTRWSYTPNEQGGLPLAEMGPVQQRLAHRLMASGLSEGGYAAAATIMGLENTLDAVEGWREPYPGRAGPNRGRDPLLYFVSVFGEPGAGSWGWRVGGHHLALNYTVVDGRRLSASPLFLGANPALTRLVGPGVVRPLAAEEDLARELLASLAPDQRRRAVLSPVAPDDLVQSNRPVVDVGPPEGLAAARMPPRQRELLLALLRQPAALAALARSQRRRRESTFRRAVAPLERAGQRCGRGSARSYRRADTRAWGSPRARGRRGGSRARGSEACGAIFSAPPATAPATTMGAAALQGRRLKTHGVE